MTQSTLSSTAALLQYPVTPTSVKLLYMLKQLLLYSPSTQSLTLTVSANSFTIAQSISDGGNGEDTYFMPTSSSIANTNDDNFEIVTSTATTITPKSTIAKGEPIKQSHWLSAFFTFQIWSNVLKQSLSQPRSLLLPSVKYVHVKMLTRSHVLRALQ
ncbi:hypothetical protein GBAR_LOCUS8669 [Geodia barretti]|uniref:Uncharacterized protein n=1 Tax=Geodia barretti TaxID=519541 RepID=A0AA35RNJ0_GEOBA|nr:hypothetical protein GBAR_LOCUS8669 [Geodia barretti]